VRSIQTDHPEYGKVVTGNEMFFDEFETYLRKNTKYDLDRDLRPQLNRITSMTFKAIKEVQIDAAVQRSLPSHCDSSYASLFFGRSKCS